VDRKGTDGDMMNSAMTTPKDVILFLLNACEHLTIENEKLKTCLLTHPTAETPGFSLDNLIASTLLVEGTEKGIHEPFDAIRQRILEHGDSSMTVKELSAAFPKATRLQ
jgi:uncharacterized protein YheU (UPF0270 family)